MNKYIEVVKEELYKVSGLYNTPETRNELKSNILEALKECSSETEFRIDIDESNNTPDVIDNNEFRADIFLKPTKSINYVTLTFVATRTGISFEEVAGRV